VEVLRDISKKQLVQVFSKHLLQVFSKHLLQVFSKHLLPGSKQRSRLAIHVLGRKHAQVFYMFDCVRQLVDIICAKDEHSRTWRLVIWKNPPPPWSRLGVHVLGRKGAKAIGSLELIANAPAPLAQ